MTDDERDPERAPERAAWLAVEPLDDVTRRRLVTNALRAAAPERTTRRTWRWVAAAAAVVALAIGGFAVVTANGGHDEQATGPPALREQADDTVGPQALGAVPAQAGDFGDLDRAANLDALRRALSRQTSASPPASSSPSAEGQSAVSDDSASRTPSCTFDPPAGGTIVAEATGTLEGRPARVVLTQLPDGSRSFDAVLAGPCEVRHLP